MVTTAGGPDEGKKGPEVILAQALMTGMQSLWEGFVCP
jgi:hypothetical protein